MLIIRKKATLLMIMILVSVFSVPIVLVTADEPSGNTLRVPQQFPGAGGLQAAIFAAAPGDRIEVSDGVYSWIWVPAATIGLEIVAVEPNVFIAGPVPGPVPPLGAGVIIVGDNTIFKGFHVANYLGGIVVWADDCIIEDNEVMQCPGFGILVLHGDDNIIRRNFIHVEGPVGPIAGALGILVGGVPAGVVTSITTHSEALDAVMDAWEFDMSLRAAEPVHIKDYTAGTTSVDFWLPDPEETDYRLPLSEEEIRERLSGDTLQSKFFTENNRVINNEVTGYFIGIQAWINSVGTIIVKNHVHNNLPNPAIGILVGPFTWNVYVVKNTVEGNANGIVVWWNAFEVVIKNNQVGNQGNNVGIFVFQSNDVDILRNNVGGNGQGIVVFGWPFLAPPFLPIWSTDIKMINNEVHDNLANGIWMYGVYGFRVQRNHVYNNGRGVPPAPGASGIHVLVSINGRVGGRRWRARNTVHDQQGDGIGVRVSNEIIVQRNEVYSNGGNQLFWFHLAPGTVVPTTLPGFWTEPGRVRFIKNRDDLGTLLAPVILGLP